MRCGCSDCLHHLGDKYVFGFIKPNLLTNANLVTRGIITYYSSFGPVENMSPQAQHLEKIGKVGVNWAVLYSSSILAILLWCAIFIVYRILRVSGVATGMRVYHRLIEMLVESAALYSAVIVVLVVFEVRSEAAEIYIEEFAIAMRVSISNPFLHFFLCHDHKHL